MADVIEKTKSSFSIGEAAEILTLSVDTLRFYEKTGVIGEIQRDQGGRRSFTQRDLDWLHFVNCLKSTGMSLDLIREYRELMMQGDHTAPRRKELMVQHKILLEKQIGDLNAAMERINYKIDYYDDVLRDQGF